MKKSHIILFIHLGLIGTAWAIRNEYNDRIKGLSDEILIKADQLKEATNEPVFDSFEVDGILAELKGLIQEYESVMVFARSPYPGEILLGTTPGGDSNWLETLCNTRYDGFLKEIRIRRTGSRASYLRINDIELYFIAPGGAKKQVFNKDGRFRLYRDGVFKLALPKPMKVRRIRIYIGHESTGLEVYGIPYNLPVVKPDFHGNRYPEEVLLGTTPAGDGTWLETLCSNPHNKPVREIQLKRTGREASYLRINDIEVFYLTPMGIRKEVFNKNGRFRLYYDGVYKLALSRPMRVTRIRVLVGHKTTGLNVYGVY